MSGELEAAGAATTAGLAAAVIEGRKRDSRRSGEGKCLNCEAEVSGAYCSQCGQATHVHRTLGHVFEEFMHGVVHFDTKAWRTLPLLIVRPGTLTHKYIHGQRARFISPLAMFLFTVFVMFFIVAVIQPGGLYNEGKPLSAATRVELSQRLEVYRESVAELDKERAALDMREPGGQAKAQSLAAIQRRLELHTLAVQAEIARRDGAPAPAGAETLTDDERAGRFNPAVELGDIGDQSQIVVEGAPEALNAKLREIVRNPELFSYKLQQAAYKFSFLLVPISLPFVALLFLWKRGHTLYDHVVFTLYSLSFVSLVFIAMSLASLSPWTSWAGDLLFLGIPIHMFFQLKGAYGLSWPSAAWRTFFLLIFASICIMVFFVIIALVGALG
jgi:hypothetical protein